MTVQEHAVHRTEAAPPRRMPVPVPRGPVSAAIVDVLCHGRPVDALARIATTLDGTDVVGDEDLQISLTMLYELHYQGLAGVPDDFEWHPTVLGLRRRIEIAFESQLRATVDVPQHDGGADASAVARTLFAMAADASRGPGLSAYVARTATRDQLDELLVHRSVYQLKEADPHTWAIPRLGGTPKAALVEIQSDEYGGGRLEHMHAALFARTMRGLGLDDSYGAYVDLVPAHTLASVNMMSMFGLQRRLRGAIVGHLAAFEMTSSIPNQLFGNGFRRHGFDADTTWYFDEHVEADAVHEQIAGRDLAGALAEQEPALLDDILFGAAACHTVDGWMGQRILEAWKADRSSLRAALA